MSQVVTFGELMMRLTTPGNSRFTQAQGFDIIYGGSEANVAVSLSNYGTSADFVTKLPAHELGQSAVNALRALGVGTSGILRGDGRLGLYFVEKGAACRKQGIIYDRADSSIALAKPSEFDWERIFAGASWFHFSGITPALSADCEQMCVDACIAAHRLGLTVSFDLNYREKLWGREAAGRAMSRLCENVDICFAYEDEPPAVFGIAPEPGSDRNEGYRQIAKKLADRFGFKKVAVTNSHQTSTMEIDWAAMLYDGSDYWFSKRYDLKAVDRIGGGDAFCGGFIHAALAGWDPQRIIEFAVAAGSMKYTVEGDFNAVTEKEVLDLV